MARYLKNKSPITVLDGQIPFKAVKSKKSDVSHLRTIKSLIYVYIPKEKRTKLILHTNLDIFVDYIDTLRMVRIYNPVIRKIPQHRDIIIDETRRQGQRLITADDDEDIAEIIIEGDFLTEHLDQSIIVSSRVAKSQPDETEGEPRDTNNQNDLEDENEELIPLSPIVN